MLGRRRDPELERRVLQLVDRLDRLLMILEPLILARLYGQGGGSGSGGLPELLGSLASAVGSRSRNRAGAGDGADAQSRVG